MKMTSKDMYKNSPHLSRGDDGKVGVHQKESEANTEDASSGHEGEPVHVKNEEHEMKSKHAMERLTLHHKHEMEHHMHKGGDKSELHKYHQKEMADMHKRHESESGSGRSDAMTKGEEIEKEGA